MWLQEEACSGNLILKWDQQGQRPQSLLERHNLKPQAHCISICILLPKAQVTWWHINFEKHCTDILDRWFPKGHGKANGQQGNSSNLCSGFSTLPALHPNPPLASHNGLPPGLDSNLSPLMPPAPPNPPCSWFPLLTTVPALNIPGVRWELLGRDIWE